jgi:hypothetical protein
MEMFWSLVDKAMNSGSSAQASILLVVMWEFGAVRFQNELLYGWQIEIILSMVPPES